MLQMFIFLFTGAYRAVPFNATIIIGSLAATTVIFAAVIAVVIAVVLLIYNKSKIKDCFLQLKQKSKTKAEKTNCSTLQNGTELKENKM